MARSGGLSVVIIKEKISRQKLKELAAPRFGDWIKGVVDLDHHWLALDAEVHADLKALLLQNGSKPNSLWGIILYPEKSGEDFLKFDSMINIRPYQGNSSKGVESPEIREKILEIVSKIVA